MVKAVIAQVDADVPVRAVHATRGKWVRAEPVAALYAQGRVLHAPGLTRLEDEMCGFGVDGRSDGAFAGPGGCRGVGGDGTDAEGWAAGQGALGSLCLPLDHQWGTSGLLPGNGGDNMSYFYVEVFVAHLRWQLSCFLESTG